MSHAAFTAEQHAKACALGFPKWFERYASPPGSGPEGTTCGDCTYIGSPPFVRAGVNTCALVQMHRERDPQIAANTPSCFFYQPEGAEHG
jgi:hypothetical protein